MIVSRSHFVDAFSTAPQFSEYLGSHKIFFFLIRFPVRLLCLLAYWSSFHRIRDGILKKPVHPTQKPIKVLSRLIQLATNPGDLVLDPFMGVGSTGVAALQLHRRFLGIEIDPLYFRAAENRMETVTPELFTSESEDHEDIADEDITDEDSSLEEPWLFASN